MTRFCQCPILVLMTCFSRFEPFDTYISCMHLASSPSSKNARFCSYFPLMVGPILPHTHLILHNAAYGGAFWLGCMWCLLISRHPTTTLQSTGWTGKLLGLAEYGLRGLSCRY
ncbi:uncharacterized protein LOC131225831 [Magnolia sinica]|uniref:uncharacterized protein LOC131225831 n=1 Tax=Magnolia sinica TaxID=86752 RepID=UPI00265A8E77|nr:uncharacterized protein LOC131225831 [Magnolia sinica]